LSEIDQVLLKICCVYT